MTPGDGTITVRGLVKRLGRRDALRGIDLTVDRGLITALIGPNGAGKTTLLRVLSTLMRPDTGVVTVNGYRLPAQANEARRGLGLVFHHPMLYGDLNARENMRFHAQLHNLANANTRIDRMLDELGLDPARNEPARTYSRGMLQRLALAKALLPQPDILLLDEPFTGLDVQSGETLNALLEKEASRGCTVLLSGHDLAGIEKLASRFIVMAEGRVVSDHDRDNLPDSGLNGLYQNVLNGANNGVLE
jgi:heme exporter protein A